ncbi:MAG: hypothetical protein ABFS86_07455, partial [Planctomycetota bacterium]
MTEADTPRRHLQPRSAVGASATAADGKRAASSGHDLQRAATRSAVIRVLHIVTTLDIGGAEAQIRDVVTRLDRDRFLPVVAWLKGEGEMAEQFEAKGVRTVNLRMEQRMARIGPVIGLMRSFR